MKLLIVSFLLLLPTSSSFQAQSRARANTALRSSAYETVLEFNRSFKQGLKFVLVPQSANEVRNPGYYDVNPIPDLESPVVDSAAEKISTTAISTSQPVMDLNAPQEPVVDVEATLEATKQVLASFSDSAAAAVESSSFDLSQNRVDPVVAKTMRELEYSLTHPKGITLPDAISNPQPISIPKFGAPSDEGLATPLLDFVKRTLESVSYPSFTYSPPFSTEYVTVKSGFQINKSLLETIERTSAEVSVNGARARTWLVDTAAYNWERAAPKLEQLRADALQNSETMGISMKQQIQSNLDNVGSTVRINSGIMQQQIQSNMQAVGSTVRSSTGDVQQQIQSNLESVDSTLRSGTDGLQQQVLSNWVHTSDALDQARTGMLQKSESIGSPLQLNGAVMQQQLASTWERTAPTLEQTRTEILRSSESVTAAMKQQIGSNMDALQHAQLDFPTESLTKVFDDLQQVVKSPGWRVDDVIQSLNLKEFGGWYAGIIVGALLVGVKQDRDAQVQKKNVLAKAAQAEQNLKDDAEKARLDGMVTELTTAVAILTSELKDMKTQKAATDHALASMKSDVRTVQSQYEGSTSSQEKLVKQLEETTLMNNVLQGRLEAAKFEVNTLKEVNEALSAGIAAVDVVLEPTPPATPPPANLVQGGDVFFATPKEGKQSPPATKVAVNKEAGMVAPGDEDDWSSLTMSVLKRKPLTELMSYLQRKGATVTDSNGRPLTKAKLVETVLAVA